MTEHHERASWNKFSAYKRATRNGDEAEAGRLEGLQAADMARDLPRWYLEELAARASDAFLSRAARLALATKADIIRDAC
jgi:hypothetical protein